MKGHRPVPDLTPALAFIAADLLDKAGDAFDNHCCNDYVLPEFMGREARIELDRAYHAWNGDPDEEPNSSRYSHDAALMGFLSAVLGKFAGNVAEMSPERTREVETERRADALRQAEELAALRRRGAEQAARDAEAAANQLAALRRKLGEGS